VTVQFYAVGGTISEDSAKFVTVAGDPVMGNTLLNAMKVKCGRGLAPIALGQLQTLRLTHCNRGQAPSHI